MTRKEYEVICRVLTASKKFTGGMRPVMQVTDRVIIENTRVHIARALCEAFGLDQERRTAFLKSAGLIVPAEGENWADGYRGR